MTNRFTVILFAAGLLVAARSASAERAPGQLPPAVSRRVSFEMDVKPILSRACFECHGERKQKSDFRLDIEAHAMRGGSIGVAIVPGKSGESALIRYVAGLDEDMRMPPKGEALTVEEISILRAWI